MSLIIQHKQVHMKMKMQSYHFYLKLHFEAGHFHCLLGRFWLCM